jgi:hypothetical protein
MADFFLVRSFTSL